MKILLRACLLWNGYSILLSTQSKYPVDISYLVSDFKYSKKDGIKICEVQHGALSAINGDLYISGQDGIIAPTIADFFYKIPIKKWATGLIYPPLQRSLLTKKWHIKQSFQELVKDPIFLNNAIINPSNPFSIDTYHGMVYADFDIVHNFNTYHTMYPGILFINATTFPYWKDKYKMNLLFNMHEELKQYKAEWQLYEKKYDPYLAKKIQNTMPSEMYVIKPRGELLANGVIVIASKDLDCVLDMILNPLPSLANHPDKKYAYWSKNKDKSFIIEKYYASDPLCFSFSFTEKTSNYNEYHYDATMRLAYILKYDQGNISYHLLGGFWKLPLKALEENGTINEMTISYGKPPFYQAINPELLKEVNLAMEKAMILLYKIMLDQSIE